MKIKRLVPVFIVIIIYVLFFTNAKYIKDSIINSIQFCGKTLIPSVFPFILLSSFIVNTGMLDSIFSHRISKLLNKLGVCKRYAPSVVSGSLSGYVTGAKCICDITEKSNVNKNEFTSAVILSSNAGLGFVISCVGILIWKSLLFGIYIYVSQLLVSALLGVLFLPRAIDTSTYSTPCKKSVIDAFTGSVCSTASSVITISSYVIVFSLICDIASILLPSPINITIYPLMEFCNGAFKCLEFSNNYIKAFFTGFTVGFGGICVHFQIFSVCKELPLNKKAFSLFKLLQGILLGILAIIYVSFINNIRIVPAWLVIFIFAIVFLKMLFKRKMISL